MTNLDATILTVSALLAAYSVASGRGIGLSFIVLFSFCINEWSFLHLDLTSYDAFYSTGAEWMAMIAAKDLIIVAILSYRLKKRELWLMLTFVASTIFHQLCRMEFYGADVDAMPMYDIRFNFMQLIAALQLTGVIINFTGGDWHGGRLVKLFIHRLNFSSGRLVSMQASKVIK
jgi:hypothetical protein